MTRIKLCALIAAVLAVSIVAPCRADLFASLSPGNQILRIDSATGNVLRTYDIPSDIPSGGAASPGLAFDGHYLYVARRFGLAGTAVLQLDVVNDFWSPPSFLFTAGNPSGVSQPISGLGYRSEEFGGSLIAVSRNPADAPPSYIFQYQVTPELPAFDPPLLNFPVGELPPNMDAMGADVDPVTRDLWISAEEVDGSTRTTRLLRTELTGTVLQTLTPALPPVTLIRGVGFDKGSMFVAGRNLPTQTNNVYEIDRTSGAVLRSFALPGGSIVGSLTGGDVIPEPGTMSLVVIATMTGWFGATRRRGQNSRASRAR